MARTSEAPRATAISTAAEQLREYLKLHQLNIRPNSGVLRSKRTELQALYEAVLKAMSSDLPNLIKYHMIQALANRLGLAEDSLNVRISADHLTEKELLSAAKEASSRGVERAVHTLSNMYSPAGIPKKKRSSKLKKQIIALEEIYTTLIEHLGSRLFVWGALNLKETEDPSNFLTISPRTYEIHKMLNSLPTNEEITAFLAEHTIEFNTTDDN